MKTYELTYIISPEITLEESESKTKELEKQIQEKGGLVIKSDKPVAKTLSYQIKKYGSGFFAVLEFQAEPEAIAELKNSLEKDSQILRHIFLVKNPAKKIKKQRVKPVTITEPVLKEVEKEKKEEKTEKTTIKKVKSEKSKEKADIEDIDKKLDEILSE